MKIIKYIILVIIITSHLFGQDYLYNTALVRFKNFQLNDSQLNLILAKSNARVARRIMPLDASVSYGNQSLFKSSNNEQYKKVMRAEEPLLRTYVIEYDGNISPDKFCFYLNKNPEIEIAEPYYIFDVQGFTPNDPLIANQEDGLELIRAFDAWEIEKGSPDIVIGISDNGMHQTHEDLRDNIATNEADPINGVDDDGNGYIDDYKGFNLDGWQEGEFPWNTFSSDDHGTKVAGLAGASFDNEKGITGIGGRSKIFPIRIGSVNLPSNRVLYGPESILYAGVKKFSVLNCSWGLAKTFSDIEQSIVDYAVANDVVIVAASGNKGSADERTSKFYPAGYEGVLGVGAVTRFDSDVAISTLGSHCRILAPSGNISTDIDAGQNSPYSTLSASTSYAAPIVAGATAIARAKYPGLDAVQIMEFVRQSVDDISEDLVFYKDITPGRLNMYKMVVTDPMSIPGIVIEKVKYFNNSGNEQDRFSLGDTVQVDVKVKNVLGGNNKLDFKFSRVYPEFQVINVLDSLDKGISINNGEVAVIGRFKFVITNGYQDKLIFRLDITDGNGYSDFLLFDKLFIKEITTFENQSIKFSIGDKGTFGYASGDPDQYRDGFGFVDKDFGNSLYLSGVYVVENDLRAITSFSLGNNNSNFFPLKKFIAPNYTATLITADPFESTKAQVNQTVELPKAAPWVRIKLELTDSLNLASQYSLGYMFDWDIGVGNNYNENTTALLESARPQTIPYERFASIYTEGKEDNQVFGVAMYSDESDALAQAGGYKRTNVNTSFLINSLKNGKIDVTNEEADIFNMIGIRFSDEFATYETKNCYLCISGASDTTLLSSYLQECASGVTSVEIDNEKYIEFNSSNNTFSINSTKYEQSEVYKVDGTLIYKTYDNIFELSDLGSGIYLIRIEFANSYVIKKISIVR